MWQSVGQKEPSSPLLELNTGSRERRAENSKMEGFQRESAQLLSKIPGFRTVEFLRAKKQSGSTQQGLHVGTGFGEFQQTP